MKSSNIGGQAVLEGIMMRNGEKYAVAVRKPNQEIDVCVKSYKSIFPFKKLGKLPLVRGVIGFIDSLILGMKTLTYSASFYEEEELSAAQEKKEQILMGVITVFSIIAAVGIFMVVPYFVSSFFTNITSSRIVLTILEGMIRMGLFLLYIVFISKMKDIQRTFMYHGAEHKCINCIEQGLDLTVENVRKSSRQHKRCGTSFLFFVMIVSMLVCFFITAQSQWIRVGIRLAVMPLIAGIPYEIIRLAGNHDSWLIQVLSRPGMWVQNLTTKEPDDSMIEVAIQAVEAVFDWKEYQRENFGLEEQEKEC